MPQAADNAGFAEEELFGLSRYGDSGKDRLDRCLTSGGLLHGMIDDSHATATQFAGNLKLGDSPRKQTRRWQRRRIDAMIRRHLQSGRVGLIRTKRTGDDEHGAAALNAIAVFQDNVAYSRAIDARPISTAEIEHAAVGWVGLDSEVMS